jgi:hypothetical protein
VSDVGHGPAERGQHRFDLVATVLIMGGVLGAVLWSNVGDRFAPRPSRTECEALLELWVTHSRKANSPDGTARGEPQATGGKALAAKRHQSVATCERQLTAVQVDCALGTPNVDELERCLQ